MKGKCKEQFVIEGLPLSSVALGPSEPPLTRTWDSRKIRRKHAQMEFKLVGLLCSTTPKLFFTLSAHIFGGISPFISAFVLCLEQVTLDVAGNFKQKLACQNSYPVYLLSKDVFLNSITTVVTFCVSRMYSLKASKHCKCIHIVLLWSR